MRLKLGPSSEGERARERAKEDTQARAGMDWGKVPQSARGARTPDVLDVCQLEIHHEDTNLLHLLAEEWDSFWGRAALRLSRVTLMKWPIQQQRSMPRYLSVSATEPWCLCPVVRVVFSVCALGYLPVTKTEERGFTLMDSVLSWVGFVAAIRAQCRNHAEKKKGHHDDVDPIDYACRITLHRASDCFVNICTLSKFPAWWPQSDQEPSKNLTQPQYIKDHMTVEFHCVVFFLLSFKG